MTPDMFIFYVTEVQKSAEFFAITFSQQAQELSPGFALFILPNGVKIGLWKTQAVFPGASFSGCGAELVLHVESDAEVDQAHARWQAAGLTLIDPPTRREFGYSFVASGPDDHRVRVLKAEG